jgi:excisionase family DNA binding protein
MTVMSQSQVAEYLGVSRVWISQLSMRGEIPNKKIGTRRLYVKEQIDKWLQEDSTRPPEA